MGASVHGATTGGVRLQPRPRTLTRSGFFLTTQEEDFGKLCRSPLSLFVGMALDVLCFVSKPWSQAGNIGEPKIDAPFAIQSLSASLLCFIGRLRNALEPLPR